MWDMLVNQAAAEWINTSERYKRMQRALRNAGYLVGKAPPGYRVICAEHCGKPAGECPHHKLAEQDPMSAPYLLRAAEYYLDEGWSLRQASAWLDDMQAPTEQGQPWQPTSLANAFRNPALYGRRMDDRRTKTELKIDNPILTREQWDRLQTKINQKARRKGVAPKTTSMLTSILQCSNCDGPMYHMRNGKAADPIWYYRCHGTKREPSKCSNMVSRDDVDRQVSDAVMAYGRLPHVKHVFIRRTDHANRIADIEQEIRELNLDDPESEVKFAELRAERNRVRDLPAEKDTHKLILDRRTVGEHWQSLDVAGRRAWLMELSWRVWARKDPEPVNYGELRRTAPALVVIEDDGSLARSAAIATGLTVEQVVAIDWIPILAMARQRGLPMDPDELVRLASNPDEIKRLAHLARP